MAKQGRHFQPGLPVVVLEFDKKFEILKVTFLSWVRQTNVLWLIQMVLGAAVDLSIPNSANWFVAKFSIPVSHISCK